MFKGTKTGAAAHRAARWTGALSVNGTVLQQRSDAGPLCHQMAVAVAAMPKMPALCQFQTHAAH